MPRSTRSDDGIRCGNVRREHDGTNVVGNAEVGIHSEDVEVRVIEDVEHLAAKLQAHSLFELPHFRQRHVPIDEPGSTEEISAHVALRRVSRWRDHGAALLVATVEQQVVDRSICRCLRETRRIAVSIVREIEEGYRCLRGPMDVSWIAREIPPVIELAGEADVVAEVAQRVRLPALYVYDTGRLPSFQQLAFGLDRRQVVSHR